MLSNHYLCANKNSMVQAVQVSPLVVNCFQIIIFVLTRTAHGVLIGFGICCELLSNHYLCANKNSQYLKHYRFATVVNCFQIIIFVLTRTALYTEYRTHFCCELLSNHYLCANKNSKIIINHVPNLVVNCFQIIIFVLTRTA